MRAEWSLIYQVRWYIWVPASLYGVIVELFMAILGLGAVGYGIFALLGVTPLPFDKTTPIWQSYGIFILELVFGAWLGWSGLRGMWAELQAILTSPLKFEGTLNQITTEMRHGKNTDYPVRVLKFENRTWEIYKRDFDSATHARQVTAGMGIRIQYRRGTELITHLWVNATDDRVRRNKNL